MDNKIYKIKVGALAILCCLIWGSAFPYAKIAFQYMDPVRLSGYRFMLAGILLLPILIVQKYNWSEIKGNIIFILKFALVQTFITYGLFYYGLSKAPASISAIVNGAGPFYVAIMAHFLVKGDTITPRKILSILFGFAGVIFISINNGVSMEEYPNFYLGVAALVMSNICGSFTNIMIVKHDRKISTTALTSFSCFIGGVGLYILSIFVEPSTTENFSDYPLSFYCALIWLAMIPASAFSLWYYLLKLPTVKVSELNVWKFLIPVFGVVLSWILLSNESPKINSIIGIVVVSISIIILQTDKKNK